MYTTVRVAELQGSLCCLAIQKKTLIVVLKEVSV